MEGLLGALGNSSWEVRSTMVGTWWHSTKARLGWVGLKRDGVATNASGNMRFTRFKISAAILWVFRAGLTSMGVEVD